MKASPNLYYFTQKLKKKEQDALEFQEMTMITLQEIMFDTFLMISEV